MIFSMTHLSGLIVVFCCLMISVCFGGGTGGAAPDLPNRWSLNPPDRGWATLLKGAIRDESHGYYYHPQQGMFFDITTNVSANVTLGVVLLPDRWFRYTYTLTNQSKTPLRTLRLPVPSRTRQASPRLIQEQTDMVLRFSESDGTANDVMTLYWGDQQGDLPITRVGLPPGKSISFSFESPDPPRPAHLWMQSDGWQFSVSSNWSVRPPNNDWVTMPVLAPVAIPYTQGLYLDSLLKDINRSPLLTPDITLPESMSIHQMTHALIGSYGTPEHATVVAKWRQRVGDLPSPSVFKDVVYVGLQVYEGLIPVAHEPMSNPSDNRHTDANKKGITP